MFSGTILTPSHSMRHPPECFWLLESTYTEKAQKRVLVWTDVNEASSIKCFESSGKVEKHCTRTRSFYFLHIVAGSELDAFFWGVYTLWRTHRKEFKQNEFYFGIGPQTWTFQQIVLHWNQTDFKKKQQHFFLLMMMSLKTNSIRSTAEIVLFGKFHQFPWFFSECIY